MATRFLVPFGARPLHFDSLRQEFNRLFEDANAAFGRSFGETVDLWSGNAVSPQLDIHEADGELTVAADLPGVAQDDIDLRVEGDLLSIRGEKRKDSARDEKGWRIVERSAGSFARTIRLPFAPDAAKVSAQYADGVLTVHVPRQAGQGAASKIAITADSAKALEAPKPAAKPAVAPVTEAPRQQAAESAAPKQPG